MSREGLTAESNGRRVILRQPNLNRLIQRSRGNGPLKLQQPPGDVAGKVLMPTAIALDDEEVNRHSLESR